MAHETNAHVADGEVVRSWCLDAGIKLAARRCRPWRARHAAPAMVARKPDHQGDHEGNR